MKELLGGPIVALGVAVARIGAALAITPLAAPSIVPALSRICIMLAFGGWILSLTGWTWIGPIDPLSLGAAVARETLIGLLIGLVMSGVLWSFQIAGQFIDQKVGLGAAERMDDTFGAEGASNAMLLSRYGLVLFAAAGGLSLFAQLMLTSYTLFPLGGQAPNMKHEHLTAIAENFGGIVSTGVMIAAPALVILTLAEAGIGLVNRIAPKLNAFSISLALKGWLAGLVLLMMTARLAEGMGPQLSSSAENLRQILVGALQ